LARSLIGSSRSIASALVTPRYASRSSTARHHRSLPAADPMLPDCRQGQDSSVVIKVAATSTDGIVGTRSVGRSSTARHHRPLAIAIRSCRECRQGKFPSW
jgi:hypothetical protein